MRIFILFLICLIAAIKTEQQFPFPEVKRCVKSMKVSTIFEDLRFEEIICIECEKGYIVSKNYKSCIHYYYYMGQQRFKNCRRLDQDGYCAEARTGLELISREEFSYISEIAFGDRCAVVTSTYSKCLYPRIGYTLDLEKQILWKDTEQTFCALYSTDKSECMEYFHGFVYDSQSGFTLYLGELFINPQQVVQNGEGIRNIKCKQNYDFIKKEQEEVDILGFKYLRTVLIGCYQNQTEKQLQIGVEYCMEYFLDKRICSKCYQGYSLSYDKQFCKLITLNCFEYDHYFGEEVCSTCEKFYQKNYLKCRLMKDCAKVDEQDPNLCQSCSNQSYLEGSKENLQNRCTRSSLILPDCAEQDKNGSCGKCLYHEYFYGKDCKQRVDSQYCITKSKRRDTCKSYFCEDGYYSFNYDQQQIPLSDSIQKQEALLIQLRKYNQKVLFSWNSCKQRMNQKIQKCKKYHPFLDKCLICGEGFSFYPCQRKTTELNMNSFSDCASIDSELQICYKCNNGYIYNEVKNICVKQQISELNCLIINEFNKCILCKTGYELSKEGVCYQIGSICSMIYPGKKILYQTKVFNNSSFTCEIREHPCQSEMKQKCIKCYQGFYLDSRSSKCIKDFDFPNCELIAEVDEITNKEVSSNSKVVKNGMICTSCQEGYILAKGICYCYVNECQQVYNLNEDKIYKTLGYHFTNNLNNKTEIYINLQKFHYLIDQYHSQFQICKIPNCETCLYESCAKCNDGYIYDPQTSKCILRCSENSCRDPWIFENQYQQYPCKKMNKENICISCDPNQFVMLNGKCQYECPFDFVQTLILGTLYCYQCPPSCLTCTLNSQLYFESGTLQCLSCVPGSYLFKSQTRHSCFDKCPGYLDQNDNCVETCKPGEFLQNKRCIEKCPHNYIKNSQDLFECIDYCNKTDYPYTYEDKPNYCDSQCTYGYTLDQTRSLCVKCKGNNCQSCQINQNICTQCNPDFVLTEQGACIFVCPNGEQVTDKSLCNSCPLLFCDQCSENKLFCNKCKKGFYLSNTFTCICEAGKFINKLSQKCDFCHPECIQCDPQQGCVKCSENYYVVQQKQITEEVTHLANTCTNQCPKGTYPSQTLIPTCLKCEQVGCTLCKSKNDCSECTDIFHLVFNSEQKSYFCECKPGYFFDGNVCKFKCPVTLKIVDNENECCAVQNCEDCKQNSNICKKCNTIAPFLIDNECLYQCPEGTFKSENNKCYKCNQLCKTCEKSSTQCTSCTLSLSIVDLQNNCKCKNGYFFLNGKCLPKCPIYTSLGRNDEQNSKLNICEPYCDMNQGLFPVFDNNNQFFTCESFQGEKSTFCEQHLSNIMQLVSFTIEPKQLIEGSLISTLKIFLSTTPYDCYTYVLQGNSRSSFNIQKNEEQNNLNFSLLSEIGEKLLTDKQFVDCDSSFCYLHFTIYHKNIAKFTIKIRINLKANILGIEGVQNSSIIEETASQLVGLSQLQESQIIPSVHSIQCTADSSCNYNKVITQPSKPITISLTAKQPFNDLSHSIKIKSIYLIGQDQTLQPITDFFYENTLSRTIRVLLSFQREVIGDLVIISEISTNNSENQNNNSNLENQPYYLTSKLELNVLKQEVQNQQEENTKRPTDENEEYYYKYFIFFNTAICFLMVLIAFYIAFRFCRLKIKSSSFSKLQQETNDSVQVELN